MPVEVNDRPLQSKMLDSDTISLLLSAGTLYAWLGGSALPELRQGIMEISQSFLNSYGLPHDTVIKLVKEARLLLPPVYCKCGPTTCKLLRSPANYACRQS